MKTFDYYREKLLDAAPSARELYLEEARQSGMFDAEQWDRLVRIAYPDAP